MSKINLSAAGCKKAIIQPNRLSPGWHWGAGVTNPLGVGSHLPRTAERLRWEAEGLEFWADHHDNVGEPEQAGQLRRTARQVEELADRIIREAGVAAWLNYSHPVVDLSTARPVAAQ